MAEQKKADESILITNCRLSYFYGFRPYEGDDGKKKFTAHLIIPTDHPQLGALSALIRKIATEKWKDGATSMLEKLKAQDKLCIHRGDIAKSGQPAYAKKLYISASSDIQPRILATVGGINQEIDQSHESAPYSGCWANVIIAPWAQDNKFGQRINAQLCGVQFLKHDERLGGGGRVSTLDEFGVVAEGADAKAPADDDIAF